MAASQVIRVPTLVVGGGIGGLATALSVASTGRAVHVLEQAEAFEEIGRASCRERVSDTV